MLEMNQKQLPYSRVSNAGFITAYFLIIFTTVTVLVSIETSNMIYRNKTLKNLIVANTYQAYEAKVLQVLSHNVLEEEDDELNEEELDAEVENENEEISDNELLEDTLTINELTFHYIKNDSTITVDILSPIEESLVIYLENDQIYDYDVVRFNED